MSNTYSILVVDDEEPICRLLQKELKTPNRSVQVTFSSQEALTLCAKTCFDVILLDIRLQDGNGLDMLPVLLHRLPGTKIIMMTGYADVDVAVTAMRHGAYDFVTKPFTLEKLDLIISRALEHAYLEQENKSLRLASSMQEQPLIGESAPMQQVRFLIEKVAPTNVPVLITGESGTGKDVVASAIHQISTRAKLPFIIKNCASLQPELARSELFGHTKGAFTHAVTAEEGLLSFAHKGTLFLDEVGELSLEVQSQLLRVLESQRYRRVGEKEERLADVRFLFATNRNLAQEVQQGRFHEALYHRINVFQISLPPLCERGDDITRLVRHFLHMLSKKTPPVITPETMHYILHYPWPGNIRELRNVIERGIILAENGYITTKSLPRELVESVSPPNVLATSVKEQGPSVFFPVSTAGMLSAHSPSLAAGMPASLKELERQHIIAMLRQTGGNKQLAAKQLGISRKTLYRKMHQLGLVFEG